MSYPYSYAQPPIQQPKRPRFLSMLAGFGISSILGIIFGQISAFLYSLIGGVECLTLPITVGIFGGSTALSFFVTRKIHKMTGRGK